MKIGKEFEYPVYVVDDLGFFRFGVSYPRRVGTTQPSKAQLKILKDGFKEIVLKLNELEKK